MTENSRLSTDLEAIRFRADHVGELESQLNTLMTEKNKALGTVSELRSKVVNLEDEVTRAKLSSGSSSNGTFDPTQLEGEIKSKYEAKRNEIIKEENRKLDEFKAQLKSNMRKNKAEYEDNNKINNFLSSGGSGITDESSKKKSSSFGSDERKGRQCMYRPRAL